MTTKFIIKSKYLLLLLLFSVCLIYNLQAQNQKKIDSLQIVLKTTKQDTTKIKAFVSLSWEYRHSIPDTAMYFGKMGLQLATKIKFNKGIALCYNGIGTVQECLGNYHLALEYFQKSLKIHEDIGNKKGMSDCYVNIGFIYGEQGNYNQTLDYLLKALKILEELGYKKEMANVYVNIGTVHGISGDFTKALEYFKLALKICEENGYKQLMAECYSSIGNIYNEQNDYSQAIEFYKKSLKIDEEFGDKNHISLCYNNIGCTLEKQGNYPLALEYEQKSLKIRKEIGDKNGISNGLIGIGSVYCKIGKYKDAITYSTNGLEYAKKIGSLICQSDAYETLSESYKGLNDYKSALTNYELFKQVNDSIFNQEKNKQIAKMEAIYQSNKKQKEIELQDVQLSKKEIVIKHQRALNLIFIGGLIIFLLFSATVIFLLQKSRKQHKQLKEGHEKLQKTTAELIESEKKSFIADMVVGLAHDLKTPVGNAMLSSDTIRYESMEIEKLIHENNLTQTKLFSFNRKAIESGTLIYAEMLRISEWIKGFQTISMDQVKNESKTINLKEYLETCIKILDFKFRMGNIICTVTGNENITVSTLPGFISQTIINLINNAIEHGFENFNVTEKKININFKLENGNVIIECYNNGKAIPSDILPKIFNEYFSTKSGIKGMGLSSVKRIVEQGMRGTISCSSSENEGVNFIIQFPEK